MNAPGAVRLPLLTLLALAAARATAQLPDLDWIDWDQLSSGEVQYQTASTDPGTVRIDVAVEIRSDRTTVWNLLKACEVSPEYVPNVRECRRIATLDDGAAELFEQVVKPAFFLPRFEHVFRLDYHELDSIAVSHVSGPIDRLEGGWWLLDRPDGNIALVHAMTLKPGFPVPRFLVRNTLEADLPGVLDEIRKRAETASGR